MFGSEFWTKFFFKKNRSQTDNKQFVFRNMHLTLLSFLSSSVAKNSLASHWNVMNKMNAKSDQQHASTFVLDANGKDHYTKVKRRKLFSSKCPLCNFTFFTATEHEANCSHPKKSGAEVMLALQATDATQSEDKKLFNTLIELLSYEKIIFNGNIFWNFVIFNLILSSRISLKDLQMKPYRTDEYVHKLFYETSRFSAFNHQWVVKARINNGQRDPHTVNERQITYQVNDAVLFGICCSDAIITSKMLNFFSWFWKRRLALRCPYTFLHWKDRFRIWKIIPRSTSMILLIRYVMNVAMREKKR